MVRRPVAEHGVASSEQRSSRLLIVGALVFAIGVILVLLVLNSGDDVATPAPSGPTTAATSPTQDGSTAPTRPTTVLPEPSGVRIPRPFVVPEGYEAVAIRTDFVRGVAALPGPGDHVNIYRLPAADNAVRGDEPAQPGAEPHYLSPNPDAETFLSDVEVLGIVGPATSAGDGSPVLIMAIRTADVPRLLPVIASGEVWMTLLPREEATPAP